MRGVGKCMALYKNIRRRERIYEVPNITQIPEKGDKTRLMAYFLDLVYLDDASSQGYMHIDKSMNEEVHALACCILS